MKTITIEVYDRKCNVPLGKPVTLELRDSLGSYIALIGDGLETRVTIADAKT